jgi:spermidine synthase
MCTVCNARTRVRIWTQVAWEEWDKKAIATHYYNQQMHSAALALPRYLERALEAHDYQ